MMCESVIYVKVICTILPLKFVYINFFSYLCTPKCVQKGNTEIENKTQNNACGTCRVLPLRRKHMKYKVEIEEILRRAVEVEAASKDEAEDKVQQLYRDCEIVLTADDFIGESTIKCID